MARRAANASRVDLDKLCFPKQLDFVKDPARMKAALCSRRAGKTNGVALMLLEAGYRHPGCIMPYVSLTKGTAKGILWQVLEETDRRLGLNLVFNQNNWSVTLDNGSKIAIYGADDRSEIDRMRGLKYPLAVLDEAQGFRPYIKELIDDILSPALMDMKGQLVLTGTPGVVPAGYFYDVTNGKAKGWSVHEWTFSDNPHIPDAEGWLQEKMAREGLTEDHPTIRREYRGQWVMDDDMRVYKLNDANIVGELPEADDWGYVLGIDLGFNDPTAFVVWAYSCQLGIATVVRSYDQAGLIPSEAAVHVEKLMRDFRFDVIVADTGGLGKGYSEEMRQRFGLPIHQAQKTHKLAYIDLMNGDLRSRKSLVLDHNVDLIHEMRTLQWNDRKAADGRFLERVERGSQSNHLCDAALYGWRECKSFIKESKKTRLVPGSPEWREREEAEMEEALTRDASKPGEPWWASLGNVP